MNNFYAPMHSELLSHSSCSPSYVSSPIVLNACYKYVVTPQFTLKGPRFAIRGKVCKLLCFLVQNQTGTYVLLSSNQPHPIIPPFMLVWKQPSYLVLNRTGSFRHMPRRKIWFDRKTKVFPKAPQRILWKKRIEQFFWHYHENQLLNI